MESPLTNAAILLASLAGLWFSANLVVESASVTARKLGMSDLVIGLTVVALGTSAPEFAVTVMAALDGRTNISIGNIVGSNIFNLGIILGIVAAFKPLITGKRIVYRDTLLLVGVNLVLILFVSNLVLGAVEGLFMILVLIVYLSYLVVKKEPSDEDIPTVPFRWWHILQLLGGLGAVILSGNFLVESASGIASYFGMSEWLIGVTIVAAGTSAPELVTSIAALIKGRAGLSIGNLIGSDLFNVLGVLGLAAFLNPLQISENAYYGVIMMAGTVALVFVFMRSGWKLSRWEALMLIAINLLRWGVDIF